MSTSIYRTPTTAAESLTGKVGLAGRLATASTAELADASGQGANQASTNQIGVIVTDGALGEVVAIARNGELVSAKIGTGGVEINDTLVAEAGTGKLIKATSLVPGDTVIGTAQEAASADAFALVRVAPYRVPASGIATTIDMADAALTLTAEQIAVSELLLVDPNSGGASEALSYPTAAALIAGPLANCSVKRIVVRNTGGEGIAHTTNTGLTLRSNPASGGATTAAGLCAEVTIIKTSGTTCDVLITQLFAPV